MLQYNQRNNWQNNVAAYHILLQLSKQMNEQILMRSLPAHDNAKKSEAAASKWSHYSR